MAVRRKLANWLVRAAGVILLSSAVGCRSLPDGRPVGLLPSSYQGEAELPLQPSNNRNWSPDLAVLPYAEIDGDTVRLRNVRNCTYRSDDEFVVKYYDKTLQLSGIKTVDFIVVPFKEAQGLAHTMMSFGFEGNEYVCMSAEARLEKDEKYSPVLGALRQYELIYVIADERDVILRRTIFRDADVYLYRTKATPAQARKLFLDVVQRVNKLYREPEFYDTLTNNCTTNIVLHANKIRPNAIPLWDPRVLLPGYADRLAFELGWLDTSRPFEQLKAEARINEQATRHAARDDFSARIRR